jgi:chemotaxis protein CheD
MSEAPSTVHAASRNATKGLPSTAPWFAQRVIVGVGDMAVSNTAQAILSTYALGSCIGVAAYDSTRKVAGLLHLMLPDSTISPAKASVQPAMFADTGLRQFFQQLFGFGAKPAHLQLFVAGGAKVFGGADLFRIGARNTEATLDFLGRHSLRIAFSDLGGSYNRTLHLEVASGQVTLKTPHAENQVSLSPQSAGAAVPA